MGSNLQYSKVCVRQCKVVALVRSCRSQGRQMGCSRPDHNYGSALAPWLLLSFLLLLPILLLLLLFQGILHRLHKLQQSTGVTLGTACNCSANITSYISYNSHRNRLLPWAVGDSSRLYIVSEIQSQIAQTIIPILTMILCTLVTFENWILSFELQRKNKGYCPDLWKSLKGDLNELN